MVTRQVAMVTNQVAMVTRQVAMVTKQTSTAHSILVRLLKYCAGHFKLHMYYKFNCQCRTCYILFSNFLNAEAIPLLTVVISDPNSRSNFLSIHATENAISAVAKICKYLKNGVPYETVLPTWLSWLPVVEDKDEAVHVYLSLIHI